jgi:peptidoglycan hydrolase-like protein with peptidoglycan-binding domain
MSKPQISFGSQGIVVKELQKILNKIGYSLDKDGIFGEKTKAAVESYQKKSGLAVDGIVGTNTWASLLGGSSGSGSSTPSFEYDAFSYAPYQESDTEGSGGSSQRTTVAEAGRVYIAMAKPTE